MLGNVTESHQSRKWYNNCFANSNQLQCARDASQHMRRNQIPHNCLRLRSSVSWVEQTLVTQHKYKNHAAELSSTIWTRFHEASERQAYWPISGSLFSSYTYDQHENNYERSTWELNTFKIHHLKLEGIVLN